jgi:hypothetical protein
MTLLPLRPLALALGAAVLAGCATSETGVSVASSALTAVSPRGAATGVATEARITLRFDRAMSPAMAAYATLHRGDVTGPLVPCAVEWSVDSTTLTLIPDSSLTSGATFTLHVGGGMRDATGGSVDLGAHGPGLGGEWATPAMMRGDSMMGGGGMGPQEIGAGWSGPGGEFGIAFTFTTA